MNFSHRTDWDRQQNKLSELYEYLLKSGRPILDLTVSNPTKCDIEYPEKEILIALSNASSLQYEPNPRGLLTAREAVCEYYKKKNIVVDPQNIFLTASTSEAYSILFKLLCNAGDSVLVPKPSYPLFDYLAQLNDVQLQYYNLRYDGEWRVDIDSLKNCIIESLSERTPSESDFKIGKIKAIVIVNLHNPTGMFLKKSEYKVIKEIAHHYNLAIIVDEVFIDYAFENDESRIRSTANETDVLTFTLNGISKMVGLPQMKLGWLVVSGELLVVSEAVARLEIICDTFLSVNTPVQVALPELMTLGKQVQKQIQDRVNANYTFLQNLLIAQSSQLTSSCSPLSPANGRRLDSSSGQDALYSEFIPPLAGLLANGGWYAIIRVPRTKSDEEWALQLLEKKCVYVYPGYYFDFEEDGYLVVSLLTEEKNFRNAIQEIVSCVSAI